MLSPPTKMWLPTAIRRSESSPSSSVTPISVRSVVPPPTSQISSVSPTFNSRRQRSPRSANQAYTAACGSSSSTRLSGRPAAIAASRVSSRPLASNDAGTVKHNVLLAHRRIGISGFPCGDQMLADSGATPRPAISWPPPPALRTAKSADADRRGYCRATTWRRPRFASASRPLAAGPIRRRRSRIPFSTANRTRRWRVRAPRPDKETTAASAAVRPSIARPIAESAAFRPPAFSTPSGANASTLLVVPKSMPNTYFAATAIYLTSTSAGDTTSTERSLPVQAGKSHRAASQP